MVDWVLRFISGKYQGGEFPLVEGTEYFVGRSSDCALVLVEDMISRQHAKFVVEHGEVTLVDLGSTNGSFVNGERVNSQQLREGDRILFGTSIIRLIAASVANGIAVQQPRQQQSATQATLLSGKPDELTSPPQRPAGGTVSGLMSGLLEEVSLSDLLQLFSSARKSGLLRIQTTDDGAAIYLRDGRVIHAEITSRPELSGERAAYRALTWSQGTFVLEPPAQRTFAAEIQMSTEALMMEAMRLMDERDNLGRGAPALTDSLLLAKPLRGRLADLSEDQLDLLQSALEADTVEHLIMQLGGDEIETLQHLGQLISRGFLARR